MSASKRCAHAPKPSIDGSIRTTRTSKWSSRSAGRNAKIVNGRARERQRMPRRVTGGRTVRDEASGHAGERYTPRWMSVANQRYVARACSRMSRGRAASIFRKAWLVRDFKARPDQEAASILPHPRESLQPPSLPACRETSRTNRPTVVPIRARRAAMRLRLPARPRAASMLRRRPAGAIYP